MPTSRGDGAGRALVVAGEQDRAQPEVARAARSPRREVGLTVSATTSTPRAAPSQPTATAVPPVGLRARQRGVAARRRGACDHVGEQPRPADDARRARRRRPGRRGPRGWRSPRRRAGRRRGRARRRRWPARSGARRRPRARRRGAAPRRGPRPSAATTSTSVIWPVVTVPVLSSTIVSTRAGGLEHLGALDQDAELGAAAGADQQRGRRGQARARTGRR